MSHFAYFFRSTHSDSRYTPLLQAAVPGKDQVTLYLFGGQETKPDIMDVTETWTNQRIKTVKNELRLHDLFESQIASDWTPSREWSVEIPDDIYEVPFGTMDLPDNDAPVNKWLAEYVKETEKIADDDCGHAFGEYSSPTEYSTRIRERCKQFEDDDLADIQMFNGSAALGDEVDAIEGAKTYTRPNGQIYFARKWGEHADVEVLKSAREVDLFALLLSPPGTGKTAAVEAAFGEDLYTLIGSGDTEVADLIGGFVQTKEGKFHWEDGPLLKAASEGKVFFIDEVGLIDPKVMSIVYSLMDGRREIAVTANPERGTVVAQEGFFVVAATNPNAPGVRLSEALLSRFLLQAEMTTDYDLLANEMGVDPNICRLSKNLSTKMQNNEITWAPQFRELLAFRDVSARFGASFALANLLSGVPEMDRDTVAQVLTSIMGRHVEPATIQ